MGADYRQDNKFEDHEADFLHTRRRIPALQGTGRSHRALHGAQPWAGQHGPAQQEGEKLYVRG